MLTILPAKRKPSVASAALCLARGARQRLLLCFLLLCAVTQIATAQFVHPGGVHTQADLDRMKAKVAANAYPWINGWNLLIADSKAQKTYVARPSANIGGSGIRQQAAKDATAAYFNTLRWYISGDTAYANCAVRILNAWSGSINQVVSGELFQLPIMMMVQAGELLRMYPGWAAADFTRFKNMCLNYFYPACHNFLGGCGSWPGWDGPANACILYIGILCDDQAKFDEAVNYYKTGNGGGSVTKAIWQTSGQITEMGRDQPHAEIGPTVMAEMCQSAWNQGVDLFSYADNRLLAGFEYFCKFNLNHAVDWVSYNDCDNHNFYYPAYRFENRISQAPAYELVYNHYVVKQGLSAPYTRAMINLRGLAATGGEYSGYCALTYTLSDTTTLFQPRPVPAAPTGLTAMAGVSNVVLKWTGPAGDVANGYNVLRSTTAGGPYTTIASWGGSDPAKGYITSSYYTDTAVTSGTTYYYRVAANNQSGSSGNSAEASATPVSGGTALPVGWTMRDIGSVATAGSATYADANSKTFVLKASGNSFGGSNDSYGYVYTSVTGDFSLTTKVFDVRLSASNADRVGLVMRESFTANAAMASIGLADNGFRQVWFASHATGGSTTWKGGHSHTGIPVWFKLERSGNTFTGYQSVDGATWFSVGSTTIAMPTTYYVGMYVNSGSTTAGVTTTATFDHVTTVGTVSISDTFQVMNRASSKYLDNLGQTTDGTEVGQWSNTGSNNQKWIIEPYGSYYRLKCLTGGKYLDNLGHTANGSTVGQWSSSSSNNQQWSIVPVGSYYRIINRANGKCLDTGGDTVDGSIIKFWPQGASYKQQWALSKLESGSGSLSMVQSAPADRDSVKPQDQGAGFIIYPNPVISELTISTSGSKSFKVEVYNISGRLLRSGYFSADKATINLNGIPSGMLVVKVDDGKHVLTQKVLKQ